jgi:hypothetical protein
MSLLAAATPKLLKIMENRSTFVIVTGILAIFTLDIVLTATLIYAPEFPLLSHKRFLFLFRFTGLLNFLLLLKF